MRRGEVPTGFPQINLRERDHLKDLGVDVRIILKRIKMWDGSMGWIDLAQDYGKVVSARECSSEPSGSTKCREILD